MPKRRCSGARRSCMTTRREICASNTNMAMRPKACLAAYDAATDRYDVYTCTQGLSLILHSLADVVNHPADKIRVYALDVGGGFGVRSEGYPEYAVVMLAAKLTGRPVKWISTRSETLISDHHGRAAKLIGE